jgi:hypothetical protein
VVVEVDEIAIEPGRPLVVRTTIRQRHRVRIYPTCPGRDVS